MPQRLKHDYGTCALDHKEEANAQVRIHISQVKWAGRWNDKILLITA